MVVINMEYNFDWKFIQAGAPLVTLTDFGIAFNSLAISLLGSPEQVVIGFDSENNVIGVKVYNGEVDVKSYDFISKSRNNWIRIGCKEFTNYIKNKLDLEFPHKCTAEYDNGNQILIVKVK